MDLAVEVYRLTQALPKEERYGLSAQMCRAAVSIASNIAEGEGRETTRERRRFLLYARGSLNELSTQLILCQRLGYAPARSEVEALVARLGRLIGGSIRYVTREVRDS